jgi:TetR/AcrR family fatty acid metabolism transcriptional regulator
MSDKKNQKADRIVEAALEIFKEKSFRDATIAEIAERASVAIGTIYEYFNSKEDLYFSIPNKTTVIFNKQLRLQLEGLYDPIEKVRKYIWFYLYFFEENPIYAELLLMELRVNRNFINSNYYQGARDATTIILQIIKEGQEQGKIRDDINPFIIRNLILGTLEHVTTYWLISGKKRKLTSNTKDFVNLIISAITSKYQNDSDPID